MFRLRTLEKPATVVDKLIIGLPNSKCGICSGNYFFWRNFLWSINTYKSREKENSFFNTEVHFQFSGVRESHDRLPPDRTLGGIGTELPCRGQGWESGPEA